MGFHETTVKETAEKAGASPGLIYNYVRDREELLLLAVMGFLESYKKEVPKAVNAHRDPIARFSAALTGYMEVVANMPNSTLLAFCYTTILPPPMRDRIKQLEIDMKS